MIDTLYSRTCNDFRLRWKQSIGFHFLMQALGLAIFGPLATFIARRIVAATGESVVTNFDLAGYALSPMGAVFVLFVAAVAIGLLLAEFAGQSWISGHAVARRQTTVLATVAVVLRRLPAMITLGARVFMRLLLLALPFLAVVGLLWFATLREQDINYYLAGQPPEWKRALAVAGALGVGYACVALWQLARWIFAVPQLVFEKSLPRQAIAESERLTKGRLGQIIPRIALWWTLMLGLGFAAAWIGRRVSAAGLEWAAVDFSRVLPMVLLLVVLTVAGGFLYGSVLLGGHQFLVTRLYAEARDMARWRDAPPLEAADQRSRALALPAAWATIALLAIAIGAGWFVASRMVEDTQVAITAHRGAKIHAPENTMASFRAAMDAGADYIELDVQRARDGTVIVLHDRDLMRMADDPRALGSLTAAEIATIDIGRKYDAAFAGEVPPTLEQVIDLVKGRMKINVELKYNVPDPELAPAVVDLLRRKEFVDQVVITSLDAAALRQIKGIEPGLKVGLIVTAAVGDVSKTPADFVSLNSARATPSLLRRAHAAGKEVHVWTVNTPEVMLLMIERGVDNIITDDPALLARVIRDRSALSNSEKRALRLRVLFGEPPREVVDPESVEVL